MTPQMPSGGSNARELPAARKTVLVVDDEEPLLRVLTLLLEDEGYQVIAAASARAALEAFERQGADVVITDFMMPEMSGNELIAAMQRLRPRVPVILMSSLDATVVERACPGHAQFFRKPFQVAELLRAISQLATGTGRDHLRLVK